MGKDSQNLWQQIWRFIQVTFETWRFLATIISILLTLGISTGILGFFTTNATFLIGGVFSVLVAGVLIIIVVYLTDNLAKRHTIHILDKYVTYR